MKSAYSIILSSLLFSYISRILLKAIENILLKQHPYVAELPNPDPFGISEVILICN